jgi:hypothetical protein
MGDALKWGTGCQNADGVRRGRREEYVYMEGQPRMRGKETEDRD